MALTTTTLSSAIALSDISIKVASATGFAAGSLVRVDGELMRVQAGYASGTIIPVQRGIDGTAQVAHAASANATVGTASEFASPSQTTTVTYPAQRVRTITSYSASGAIAVPNPGSDAVAILNGTGTLAMTLTDPAKTQDGDRLTILGNGKSASTVTYTTTGYGNAGASYDKLTFQTAGQVGFELMAANGAWVITGAPPITGTSTAVSIAID